MCLAQGFAYVGYRTAEAAAAALQQLNGMECPPSSGQRLKARAALLRPAPRRRVPCSVRRRRGHSSSCSWLAGTRFSHWVDRTRSGHTRSAPCDGTQVKYADPQALRGGPRGAPPLAEAGSASVRSDSNDSVLQCRAALRDAGAGTAVLRGRSPGDGHLKWFEQQGRQRLIKFAQCRLADLHVSRHVMLRAA